jgi:N-acetylmuramoyl-L-alanine amidase
LEERTAIANNEGADLLISIHANSTRNRSVSGVETFFLSFAADPDELEVASRENASSQLTIRELEGLLHKIALDDFSEESRDLASVVQHNLHSTIALHRSRWRDRGVKKAPFVVLINSAMPSILTEIGFLSNPDDERFLASEKGKNQIAEALYKGVEEYFRALGNPSPYEKADTEGSR